MPRLTAFVVPFVGALLLTIPAGASTGVDLSMSVSDGGRTVRPGDRVQYSVRVALLRGSKQAIVRLRVAVPRALRDVRFSWKRGKYDRSSGLWRDVALVRGKPLVLNVSGTVAASAVGSIALSAGVQPRRGATDTNARNNSAVDRNTVAPRVKPQADLSVAVGDGKDSVRAGSTSSYTVTLSNAGPAAVTGAAVRLTLPPQLQSPAVNVPVGTYDNAAVVWSGISLASGGSATLTLSGSIASGASGSLAVRADIATAGDAIDTNGGNDSATDTTKILETPPPPPPAPPTPAPTTADMGVSVAKTSDNGRYTFTFTVTNYGPAAGTFAARLHFTMGTIVDVHVSRGTWDSAWNWIDTTHYAVGESATLTIMIDLPLPDPVSLTVTGGLPDPNPGNNTAVG